MEKRDYQRPATETIHVNPHFLMDPSLQLDSNKATSQRGASTAASRGGSNWDEEE